MPFAAEYNPWAQKVEQQQHHKFKVSLSCSKTHFKQKQNKKSFEKQINPQTRKLVYAVLCVPAQAHTGTRGWQQVSFSTMLHLTV